jgi:hypothetical protein
VGAIIYVFVHDELKGAVPEVEFENTYIKVPLKPTSCVPSVLTPIALAPVNGTLQALAVPEVENI